MKDVLLDTLLDSAKLLPFLFFAFLIIEWLERKLNKKTEKAISKSGKLGPIFGSALGIIPQCGFGVVATNLYITRIITLGTLFSVYLSTSDEMLPVLLSEKAPIDLIIKILAIKYPPIFNDSFGYKSNNNPSIKNIIALTALFHFINLNSLINTPFSSFIISNCKKM